MKKGVFAWREKNALRHPARKLLKNLWDVIFAFLIKQLFIR